FNNFSVICQTISRTYQTINRQELQSALGRLSSNDFEALIKVRGWKELADDSNSYSIAIPSFLHHQQNIFIRARLSHHLRYFIQNL
ncbi:unnamed protein product, partial [Rotaria sordida]